MKQRWLVCLLVLALLAGCAGGARQSRPQPQPEPVPEPAATAPPPAPLPRVQPDESPASPLPDLTELLKGQPGPAVPPAFRWKRPQGAVDWEPMPDGRLLLRAGAALTMLAPDGSTQWSRTWDGPVLSMYALGEQLVLREQQGAVFVLAAADGHTEARWRPVPGQESAVTVTPEGFVVLTRTQRGVMVATPDGVLGTLPLEVPAGERPEMAVGADGGQFIVMVPGRTVSVYDRALKLQWVLPLQLYDGVRHAQGAGIIWISRMGGKLEAWSPAGDLLVRLRYDPAAVTPRRVLFNGALVVSVQNGGQSECLLTPTGQLFGCFPSIHGAGTSMFSTESGDEIWAYRL